MSSRLVLVDDTDPNIQYYGSWFAAQNTQSNTGTNGPPFENTLHGANVNASFCYFFSGSKIAVLGTSITANISGTQDPTWECFVDNISIGSNISAGPDAENNWVLCQSNLQDGPHVLTTNVTILHNQTFWFDQIQYLPSSNVSLDNSTLRVDSSDPAVQYSSGWTELDGIVNLTQTTGSTVTYDFFGVSISWLGFVPSNFSLTPASATYSIDGRTPVQFSVPGLISSNAPPLYNQVFFKTKTLSLGRHELIVTYQGNSGTAPLALDYFVVQNGTSSSATSAPTSVYGAAPSASSGGSSNPTSNLGSNILPLVGIIVGVVGGVIVFVLLLLFYFSRRNKWRAQKLKENPNPEPFPLPPQNYTSEVRSLTPQPFSSKFYQSREPVDAFGTYRPTPPPPVTWARTDPIKPTIRNTKTRPIMQPSTSARRGGDEFLRHADSGVRLSQVQGNLVELPPFYTIG